MVRCGDNPTVARCRPETSEGGWGVVTREPFVAALDIPDGSFPDRAGVPPTPPPTTTIRSRCSISWSICKTRRSRFSGRSSRTSASNSNSHARPPRSTASNALAQIAELERWQTGHEAGT